MKYIFATKINNGTKSGIVDLSTMEVVYLCNEVDSKILLRILNYDNLNKLIEFQNFLILDGQLDIDPNEVKRNAEIFLSTSKKL
jgi:hypothetical protein